MRSLDAMDSSPAHAPHALNRLIQVFTVCSLGLLVLISQFPSSVLLNTRSIFRPWEVSTIDKMEHMFATKTRYWDQRHGCLSNDNIAMARTLVALPAHANMTNQSPLRQELKLIQTQIVARHGIRYPTGGSIFEIYNLLDRLKPFEDLLPAWMRNYTLPYNLSVEGELAVSGKDELRKLAVRHLVRSGLNRPETYSKEKFRIAHTCVARTRDSAIAFVNSFFENPEDVEYIEYPKDKDVLLRFFDQCPRYQREVKRNQTAQVQLRQFQNCSTMTKVARWLKQSLGLKEESINFSAKDLMTVQSACAFDIALYHHKHHWCSITSKTFIRSLEYLDDLEQFYWIGGGYKINYEMASLLLREIFYTMKEKATGKSTLVGNFFFAHAETTLPLLGYGDRTFLLANATETDIESRGFRSSILSPFAANIAFHLYKRTSSDEDFYVEILINEKEFQSLGVDAYCANCRSLKSCGTTI
ncbi:hypothetical protein DVH05_008736 [Phytophthora capsici]|nr:hypothetical protein DVH05_008736 [Phytophthora capsici]